MGTGSKSPFSSVRVGPILVSAPFGLCRPRTRRFRDLSGVLRKTGVGVGSDHSVGETEGEGGAEDERHYLVRGRSGAARGRGPFHSQAVGPQWVLRAPGP